MDRPTSNSGFTLAEACAALFLITAVSLLFFPFRIDEQSTWHSFPDAYLQKQSEAIRRSERTAYLSECPGVPDVTFNEKGNVSRAATLRLQNKSGEIIIELGGGRLVFR